MAFGPAFFFQLGILELEIEDVAVNGRRAMMCLGIYVLSCSSLLMHGLSVRAERVGRVPWFVKSGVLDLGCPAPWLGQVRPPIDQRALRFRWLIWTSFSQFNHALQLWSLDFPHQDYTVFRIIEAAESILTELSIDSCLQMILDPADVGGIDAVGRVAPPFAPPVLVGGSSTFSRVHACGSQPYPGHALRHAVISALLVGDVGSKGHRMFWAHCRAHPTLAHDMLVSQPSRLPSPPHQWPPLSYCVHCALGSLWSLPVMLNSGWSYMDWLGM